MTVLLVLAAPAVAFPVVMLGGGALIGLFVAASQWVRPEPSSS